MLDIAEVTRLKKELGTTRRWFICTVAILIIAVVCSVLVINTVKEHPTSKSCIEQYPKLFIADHVVPLESSSLKK